MSAPHPLVAAIRARRLQLEVTQTQAAERAGMAQASWARLERGDREPTVSTLERMALAVDLDVTLTRREVVPGARLWWAEPLDGLDVSTCERYAP